MADPVLEADGAGSQISMAAVGLPGELAGAPMSEASLIGHYPGHGDVSSDGSPPVTGQLVTGQPVTGQPVTGQPVTGQPVTGRPATPRAVLPTALPAGLCGSTTR